MACHHGGHYNLDRNYSNIGIQGGDGALRRLVSGFIFFPLKLPLKEKSIMKWRWFEYVEICQFINPGLEKWVNDCWNDI